MRVVVASPGAGRTMRGYEVFAVQLTESLREAEVDVTLLAGGVVDGAVGVRSLERRSAAARALARAGRVGAHSIEQYSFALAAVSPIRRLAPDVVVASESALFGVWNRLRRALGPHQPRFVLTNGGSRRPPFRSVDAVIHHAADLRELAVEAEPSRTHVHLPCPIEVESWETVTAARGAERRLARRRELGIGPDSYVIACVGAIDRAVKGIDRVAEAVAALPAALDAHLLLIGREGPDDGGLVAELGTRLDGRVTTIETAPADVGPTLAAADLHVSASLTEGFGRVFLEAQAWGVPNLVHDTARSRIVTGGLARFVDTADARLFAQEIEAHATGRVPHEPQAAWAHAEANGWGALGPDYLEALQAVAASETSP